MARSKESQKSEGPGRITCGLGESEWNSLENQVAVKFDAFAHELNARYGRLFQDICASATRADDRAGSPG